MIHILGATRGARFHFSLVLRSRSENLLQAYLLRQNVSSQISQGKLEPSIVAIDDNLQCDQCVWVDRTRCMRLTWAGHGRRSGSGIDLCCDSSSVMSQTTASFKNQCEKRCRRNIWGFELVDVEGNGRGNEGDEV
jgi:hypothetical protein